MDFTSRIRSMTEETRRRASCQLDRILDELDFAAELLILNPEHEAVFRPCIERAKKIAARMGGTGSPEELEKMLIEAEAELAPLGETAKSYTVHCIGHGHIDMNWMWPWQETVTVTVDTFTTVLKLLREYPGFIYSQSQASVYRIMEDHAPELLEEIKGFVKAGRWEVTASHWVETDKNMVSGESLCLHLLHTRRYMSELFGLRPEDVPIDWSPDTFGHCATVPDYLIRGGVKYLYLHRPGTGSEHHELFRWHGSGGASVIVKNDMRRGYNGKITPAVTTELVRFVKEAGGRDFIFVYGVGDHGGGPTRGDIERIIEFDRRPIFPRYRFSTTKAFFEKAEVLAESIPQVRGELNTEFAGCFTTQTLIKKANRESENALFTAELSASLAQRLTGFSYPEELLRKSRQDMLFSHFHDILPGSGVAATRTYTHGLFQSIMATAATVTSRSLRRLSERIDTASVVTPEAGTEPPALYLEDQFGAGAGIGEGLVSTMHTATGSGKRVFVLFNPTSCDREEVVTLRLWDNSRGLTPDAQAEKRYVATDPAGARHAVQLLSAVPGKSWGHAYVDVAVPVSVPGFGYAVYGIDSADEVEGGTGPTGASQLGGGHHCRYSMIERDREGLENEHFRLELDPRTGGIRRLLDKLAGTSLIEEADPAPIVEFAVERPHPMSAWLIANTGTPESPRLVELTRSGNGPLTASITARYAIRNSEVTVTFTLHRGDPVLHIAIDAKWLEWGSVQTGVPVLRARFPLIMNVETARYEIPFGSISRPHFDDRELPALRWVTAGEKQDGSGKTVIFLNDCKHGHSFEGSTYHVTLIRSSYAPDPFPELGEHSMRLGLTVHGGDIGDKAGPAGAAMKAAERFGIPLVPVSAEIHAGELPASGRFIGVRGGGIVVTGIKKADTDDGLIVRLCECSGVEADVEVSFERSFFGRIEEAVACDILERPSGKPIEVKDALVRFRSSPGEITTLRVRFGENRV